MFSAEELRRFVGSLPGGQEIAAELLGASASLHEMCHSLVTGLDRRGQIDSEFFALLSEYRPRRNREIEQLARGIHVPVEHRVDSRTPRYADPRNRQLGEDLQRAYTRRAALARAGVDTAQADDDILQLRRMIRQGGQLRPGDLLGEGRYLLLEPIGRGGFA
ncbi:MAG: hypothetical protein AAGC55_28780, partial [Myxococcota bacterium]